MPGSIQNAAPATVLPQSLSSAFTRAQEYPVIENEYRNGESQRSVQVNNSRKRWRLAKRLPPTPLQTLRDFYEARTGPAEPFYFYNPYETNPKFSWDPTGVAPTGRYTVRFDGEWSQTVGPARSDVSIELIELA
jgi:phage-related protein